MSFCYFLYAALIQVFYSGFSLERNLVVKLSIFEVFVTVDSTHVPLDSYRLSLDTLLWIFLDCCMLLLTNISTFSYLGFYIFFLLLHGSNAFLK